VICGTKSSWRLDTSSLPHEFILQPILYKIFINNLHGGAECTLSVFTDNTKLGGVDDAPDRCAAIQRNLDRLKKWAHRNIIMFNRGRRQVLHLGRNKTPACQRPAG